MFGTRTSGSGTEEPRHPDIRVISGLSPYERFDEDRLAKLRAAARVLTLSPGPWQPPDTAEVSYLHKGRLLFEYPDGSRRQLSHEQSACAFPLPETYGLQITAMTSCELILVPSRFLHALPTQNSAEFGGFGIECHEGDIEDELYLDFYQRLKAGNCELPSMPDLAVRIGEVIDDPHTASEDIARVIQSDPALAARVMSVVNSAAFGAGHPIGSLSQAVSRLGRARIRNLVFSFIVRGVFQTDSSALKQRMKALWAHSCHVAAIAAILARHTPGLDADHALLAGLIHDIGVLPVLDTARRNEKLLHNTRLLDRVVDELRGEIGALTMRQWGFGQDMIDIAAYAEDWFHLGSAIPDYLDVVLLAQLHAFVGTQQMAKLPRISQVPAFRKLVDGSLTPQGSLRVIAAASKEIDEMRHLLEAP